MILNQPSFLNSGGIESVPDDLECFKLAAGLNERLEVTGGDK